jgi:hypothetical protein
MRGMAREDITALDSVRMQRTIVVGDVHGCREELEDLLQACGWRGGDRVALVGDICAKGPDSQGVVALCRARGFLAVMGNHDAHVLRLRDEQEKGGDGHKAKPEHQQVVDSLTAPDWRWLEALPPMLPLGPERPGEADTVVVHAGVVPGVPLASQDRECLLTLRSIRDDGTPTKKLKGTPWASLWKGPERIVFGHDAVRGLQQHPFATGLDTGCVYGGKLTALLLPERRLVSVPARRAYVPM